MTSPQATTPQPRDPQPIASRRPAAHTLAVVAAALAAMALTLAVARVDRPGVGPDAVAYVAVANSIHDGGGIGFWLEDPLTTWPPLWPAMIAVTMALTGLRADLAALVLNVAAAGACVVAGTALARHVLRRKWLVHTTTAALAISPLVVGLAVLVQTEVVFTLLVLGCLLALTRWITDAHSRWLVLAGLVTTVAFYVRYQALYTAPVFAGWIGLRVLLERRPVSHALRAAAWYSVPAVLPALAWIARNLAVGDSALGPRFSSDVGPVANLLDAFATTFKFLTSMPVVPVAPAAVVTAVGIAAASAVLERRTRPSGESMRASLPGRIRTALMGPVGLLTTFVVVFTALMVVTRSMVGFDNLDIRLLAPCFVPTSLLFLRYCEIVLLDRPGRALGGRAVVGVWFCAQLAVSVALVGPLNDAVRDYGYNADRAVAASRSSALDALPEGCVAYSNNPGDLYRSGFQARVSPRKVEYKSDTPTTNVADLLAELDAGVPSCLLWVEYSEDEEFYSPSELAEFFVLIPLASADGVRAYRLDTR